MADSHDLQFVKCRTRELIEMAGAFTSGGTGVVTSVTGQGFSVTKSSTTGRFIVTLDTTYPQFRNYSAWISSITPANINLIAEPITDGKTLAIQTYGTTTTGTAALAEVPVNYQIQFEVVATNSSQSL